MIQQLNSTIVVALNDPLMINRNTIKEMYGERNNKRNILFGV